jgi:hypothetical protein
MRIIESRQAGACAFTVYPASDNANLLLKDLARYAMDNELFFTVGSHEADPDRVMHLSQLTPAQAERFRDVWGQYLVDRRTAGTGSV